MKRRPHANSSRHCPCDSIEKRQRTATDFGAEAAKELTEALRNQARRTRSSAFDAVRSDADYAYYDYTAVLPMPFPVTAGARYWLLIRADRLDTEFIGAGAWANRTTVFRRTER